jgi:hypothetical protein
MFRLPSVFGNFHQHAKRRIYIAGSIKSTARSIIGRAIALLTFHISAFADS